MSTVQLKEYISHVKNLEISCYQQNLLCNHLKGTIVNLKQSQTNVQPKAENVKPTTVLGRIFMGLFSAVVFLIGGILVGAVCGLIIALIIGIIKFCGIVASDNILVSIFHSIKTFLFGDLGVLGSILGKGIITGIKIGGGGGLIVGFLIGAISGNTKKKAQKRNEEIAVQNTTIDEYVRSIQSQIIMANNLLKEAEQNYTQTLDILNQYYSANIIYPKYRNLVAVSMFEEYIQSGRCSALEGHEGAYNLYENELKMNLILTKLDDIIDRLDQISENQYMLAQSLQKSRQEVINLAQSINASLEDVKESASTSAYFNRINAQNISYLKWMTFLRS